jgi:hypothetical protein
MCPAGVCTRCGRHQTMSHHITPNLTLSPHAKREHMASVCPAAGGDDVSGWGVHTVRLTPFSYPLCQATPHFASRTLHPMFHMLQVVMMCLAGVCTRCG